jgi:CRP-like cAMP-binding protein
MPVTIAPALRPKRPRAGVRELSVPVENRLLASLPEAEYRRLLPRLEQVTLRFGEILYEPGETIEHVYFPSLSLVSLLTLVDERLALEVGLVGCEGAVGVPVALGFSVSPVRALVQGAGVAMRIRSAQFLREMRQNPHFQRAFLRYTHALMTQVAQTAACNRFHLVEARLARWLLMTRDRVQSNEIHLTQAFLSHMLGVRRVGVTKAAGALQRRGLLEYSRGYIRIVDPHGLEATACSCYQATRL